MEIHPNTLISMDIGFQFYPKSGIWSRRVYYDILNACQENLILSDIEPASSCDGGWSWSSTSENSQAWNSHIGNPENKSWPRQIRTYGVSKTLRGNSDWKTVFPKMSDFDEPIEMEEFYTRGKTSVPCITCRAKYFPRMQLMTEFMKIIQSLGHIILSYHGFKIVNELYIKNRQKTIQLFLAPELKLILQSTIKKSQESKFSQVD